MAKKVKSLIKLQIPAGKANPAPPVGPALGQHGLNIQDFCTQFNEKTKDKGGDLIPVIISVYEDRSFSFIVKTPPMAEMIKKKANLKKGSGVPQKDKVANLTENQVREIAEDKMIDTNAYKVESAMNMVKGTARSMGVTVK